MTDDSAELIRFISFLKEMFQKYGLEVLSEVESEDTNADKTEN